jgi:LacI family transcriptional regulator
MNKMVKANRRRRVRRDAQVTLTDVARGAAVSTASASRALTRPDAVSDELRLRVHAVASTLGYVPNSAARALVNRKTGLIGAITGDLAVPGIAPALAALEAKLAETGWTLLLAGGKDATALNRARTLVGRGVEALAFLGIGIPTELGELRGIQRLPCISVDRKDGLGFAASTGLDLGHAGKLIGDYLGYLGHRRLAVVAETQSAVGALLFDALRAEQASTGFALELLRTGEGTIAEDILKWGSLPNPPTAAICDSDAMALAVMHTCSERGIDTPGRLSVLGFGDSSLARLVSPTLTSVRIPAHQAGVAAAEYLVARLAGHASGTAKLAVKIVVRGSTGIPPI